MILLARRVSRYFDLYFAGNCLITLHLDRGFVNGLSRLVVMSAAAISVFFQMLGLAAFLYLLMLVFGVFHDIGNVILISFPTLAVFNLSYGLMSDRYVEFVQSTNEEKRKLLLRIVTFINLGAFVLYIGVSMTLAWVRP